MFETAAIITMAFIAALFAYLTFKVDHDRIHLQILFLVVSLFFAASTVYAISDFSLQSQTQYLINETTTYTYGNYTDAGGGNHTLIVNETTTPVYGNHTDYAYQNEWYMTHYGVLMIITTFVLLYLLLLFLISVFTWFSGNKGRDDDI